jgi:hypothetical protein
MTIPSITPEAAHTIACRLTVGQMNTILGMSADATLLGCSEPCARQLMQAAKKRPPLVERVWKERVSLYALNADGLVVRAAIEAMA